MLDFLSSPSPLLQRAISTIEENLSDESFGVAELASRINMSRSSLLRKIKQETGLSASVFIRRVRLHHGRLLLKEGGLTVSEISFKVGFNSTSYFTKCFREEYGHTPSELSSRGKDVEDATSERLGPNPKSRSKTIWVVASVLVGAVLFSLGYRYVSLVEPSRDRLTKSIAVLPFKNDSNDSTNVFLMNGLMEAILDNLQKVEDIKVTSRTTVERYRGVSKTIPELSEELGVNYFIEGSGQKIGNEILLTIQLIEAPSDKHLWSKRYQREAKDIFQLQMDVAKNIADEINVFITPEENERIEKIPTNNLVAYDYYLTGLALIKDKSGAGLLPSIEQFKKAILEDGEFTNAYAYIAIAYYYDDLFKAQKQHTEDIRRYTEKAVLLDPDLGETLIAKAIYFMQVNEFEQAVQSFEHVLSYYPNLAWVHNFLSNIYTTHLPNTEKYLTHALQGIQGAAAEQDSSTASITYLHLSNALAQTGFISLAERYVLQSLTYDPDNLYSEYLHTYIKLSQNFDLDRARLSLLKTLRKDSTRLDVIQEIAKVNYTRKSYEEAWLYYDKLVTSKKALQFDIYEGEDVKIGYVLDQLGRRDEARSYFRDYLAYAENDESVYRELSLSAYYAATGNIEQAIHHFKAFSEMDNYQYWIVLFLEKDPILLEMSEHPDFSKTVAKIRATFWAKNRTIRKMLEQEGVL